MNKITLPVPVYWNQGISTCNGCNDMNTCNLTVQMKQFVAAICRLVRSVRKALFIYFHFYS